MKRTELIGRLLKEGFSEKTLVNFTDKQLNDLSERIVTTTRLRIGCRKRKIDFKPKCNTGKKSTRKNFIA